MYFLCYNVYNKQITNNECRVTQEIKQLLTVILKIIMKFPLTLSQYSFPLTCASGNIEILDHVFKRPVPIHGLVSIDILNPYLSDNPLTLLLVLTRPSADYRSAVDQVSIDCRLSIDWDVHGAMINMSIKG